MKQFTFIETCITEDAGPDWEGNIVKTNIHEDTVYHLAELQRLVKRYKLVCVETPFIGNFSFYEDDEQVENKNWVPGAMNFMITRHSVYLVFEHKTNPQATAEFSCSQLAIELLSTPKYTVLSNANSDFEGEFSSSTSLSHMESMDDTHKQEFDTEAECSAYAYGIAAAVGYNGNGIVKTFKDVRTLIDEDNDAMLAEFLGLRSTEYTKSGKPWYDAHDMSKAGLPFSPGAMGNGTDTLNFKSSWDWLMVVINKVNSLVDADEEFLYITVIRPDSFSVIDYNTGNTVTYNENGETDLQVVYFGVVEFVKTLNKQ